MSRGRKTLDTTLIRPKDEIDQDQPESELRDMSQAERTVKRASFDIYEDQITRLGMLKYSSKQKISDMVREALDDYLAKHE